MMIVAKVETWKYKKNLMKTKNKLKGTESSITISQRLEEQQLNMAKSLSVMFYGGGIERKRKY